jgi:YVTN family beta-propeller protein
MSLRRTLFPLLLLFAGALACAGVVVHSRVVSADETPTTDRTQSGWRGPAALWLSPDGATLLAACEKTGTIVAIDTHRREKTGELAIGKSLVALAGTPDGRTLVACDAVADELIVLEPRDGRYTVRSRVTVAARPAGVVLSEDGRTAWVTSKWSRELSRVDLTASKVVETVRLEFSPRNASMLPDGHTLVVADAFGGQFAIIDVPSARIVRELSIPGHNVRGLALSPDGQNLLVSHMILTESAATTRDNVFWGIVMTSNVRIVPIAALVDAAKNPVREAHTHFFGDPGNAAGDPGPLALLPDGTAVVTLSGVGEVAIGRFQPFGFRRVHVGQRPVDLAVSPDRKRAYVANMNSDTISVVRIEDQSVEATIALGSAPQWTVAEQGERLFYDARQSLDGWFSCHSCHTDGHTNGQRADTFGDGSYGAPKNVLSLLGAAATGPWAWNGSKAKLEEQIHQSLAESMQSRSAPSERSVTAIAAYLDSLPRPPVVAWQTMDRAAIDRGDRVFTARGCATCHEGPTYSSTELYDVGIDDGEGGNSKFNPPSLRGLVHSGPYFHDGRAKTLEDVFRVHNHRLRTALVDDELNDLIAFLKSL